MIIPGADKKRRDELSFSQQPCFKLRGSFRTVDGFKNGLNDVLSDIFTCVKTLGHLKKILSELVGSSSKR